MFITVLRVLLMIAFVAAGGMKAFRSREQLLPTMGWIEDVGDDVVKGIGYLEILAGVGVALPALLGILPWLSTIAGAGLITICAGAIWTHYNRNETTDMIAPAVIGILSIIVTFFA